MNYDMNEQAFPNEHMSYAHYGKKIPIRVPQLAPQYQKLSPHTSVSSIPRQVKWVPPRVSNVSHSYPSSIVFGEETSSNVITYQDFYTGRFYD